MWDNESLHFNKRFLKAHSAAEDKLTSENVLMCDPTKSSLSVNDEMNH